MSTNIFEQMKQIAEKVIEETKNTDHPLLTNYTNDLYFYDRNIMELDSQRGDKYIWIIKDNGCGTYTALAGTDIANYYAKESGDKSKLYIVSCDGENKGVIKEVSKKEAINILNTVKIDPNRIPRRKGLSDQINEMLGFKDYNAMGNSLMGSEFNPRPNDISVMKITAKDWDKISITLARTKMTPNDKNDQRIQKAQAQYFFNSTFNSTMDFKEPKYFVIKTTQQSYAVIEETTKKVFDNAMKKTQEKEKTSNEELSV